MQKNQLHFMRSKKVLVKQRGNLLDLHHCKIEFLKKQLL